MCPLPICWAHLTGQPVLKRHKQTSFSGQTVLAGRIDRIEWPNFFQLNDLLPLPLNEITLAAKRFWTDQFNKLGKRYELGIP